MYVWVHVIFNDFFSLSAKLLMCCNQQWLRKKGRLTHGSDSSSSNIFGKEFLSYGLTAMLPFSYQVQFSKIHPYCLVWNDLNCRQMNGFSLIQSGCWGRFRVTWRSLESFCPRRGCMAHLKPEALPKAAVSSSPLWQILECSWMSLGSKVFYIRPT